MSELSYYKVFRFVFSAISNKKLFLSGLFVSFLGSLLSLVFPKMAGNIFDAQIINDLSHNKIYIFNAILLFLGSYIVQGIAMYVLSICGVDAVKELRKRFVLHTLNLKLTEYEQNSAGDLTSRLTNDMSAIAKIITVLIPQLFMSVIVILGSLILLFSIDAKLTLMSIFIIPLFLLMLVPLNIKIEYLSKMQQELLGKVSDKYVQRINNIKMVKVFLGENQEVSQFEVLFDQMSITFKKITRVMV